MLNGKVLFYFTRSAEEICEGKGEKYTHTTKGCRCKAELGGLTGSDDSRGSFDSHMIDHTHIRTENKIVNTQITKLCFPPFFFQLRTDNCQRLRGVLQLHGQRPQILEVLRPDEGVPHRLGQEVLPRHLPLQRPSGRDRVQRHVRVLRRGADLGPQADAGGGNRFTTISFSLFF